MTDNTFVGPEDYDLYCVKAPLDSRLPNGGGYDVCGNANIKQNKFGQVSNLVTAREPFGEFESRNDFFNVAIDARLAQGIRLGGGVDTGRSVAGNCFIVDSPGELQNCRVVSPFRGQTQYKAHGVFPLPADFVASFAYQNLSGPSFNANYIASNAEIFPSLGRSLSGGATTANIPLVAPQTMFEDRIARLDLRLSHSFHDPAIPGPAEPGRLQCIERQLGPCAKQPVRVWRPGLVGVAAAVADSGSAALSGWRTD